MNEQELLAWYEQFKTAMAANGLDLDNKADLFRIRCIKTNEEGADEMHYAFSKSGTESSCAYSMLDNDDPEFVQKYEEYRTVQAKFRKGERELSKKPDSPEKDAQWVELKKESLQATLMLDKYLNERMSERFNSDMENQTLPENDGNAKLDRIRQLHGMVQSGKLFILQDRATDPQGYRQIYNDDNGNVIVGDKEKKLQNKKVINEGEINAWAEKKGEIVIKEPSKPQEPPKPVLEKLGKAPPKPNGLRRFLCSKIPLFNKWFGKPVSDYDNYMAAKGRNEEKENTYAEQLRQHDAALRKYEADLPPYQEQQRRIRQDLYHERGLYTNNQNVDELSENAQNITFAMGDVHKGNVLMGEMLTGDPTAVGIKMQRLQMKNQYLILHQVQMSKGGLYSKDGKLTEKGKQQQEREKTHVFTSKDLIAMDLKALKADLGDTVNEIKGGASTEYAKYIHLRRLEREHAQPDGENMADLAPWHFNKAVKMIEDAPKFMPTLMRLNGKKADADTVLQEYDPTFRPGYDPNAAEVQQDEPQSRQININSINFSH